MLSLFYAKKKNGDDATAVRLRLLSKNRKSN